MGFKALTVNTAVEAAGHIYAEDDAAIFQSMFGGDGVLNIGNCLKSTVISNNKVRISDGVLSVGGHIGRLSHADYQDMTIENGATGYNRNDIIYARFLTSGNVDSFILAVKKGTATTGTATDPALVQGNLYEGAVERDYPLYRVKLSGLSISSVDQLFTVIPTIPDLKAQMEKDKAEINQSLTQQSYINVNQKFGKNISVLVVKCNDRYIVSGMMQLTADAAGQDIFSVLDNGEVVRFKDRCDVLFADPINSKIYPACGVPGSVGIESNTTAIPSGLYIINGIIQ